MTVAFMGANHSAGAGSPALGKRSGAQTALPDRRPRRSGGQIILESILISLSARQTRAPQRVTRMSKRVDRKQDADGEPSHHQTSADGAHALNAKAVARFQP